MKSQVTLFFICASVATSLSGAPLRAGEGSNGGRGGGMVLLCYKETAVRNQVDRDLQAQDRHDGSIGDPRPEVNLRLTREDLVAPPIVMDYYEVMKAQGRELKDYPWPSARPRPALSPEDELARVLVRVSSRYYLGAGQLRELDPVFWKMFAAYRTRVSDWLLEPAGVPRVSDATFDYALPENCLPVQVAYFDDRIRRVRVDGRIFALLDDDNRDSLWLHEDFTHYYRAGATQAKNNLDRLGKYFANTLRSRCKDESKGIVMLFGEEMKVPETTNHARALASYLISGGEWGEYSPERVRRLTRLISLATELYEAGDNGRAYVRNAYSQADLYFVPCTNFSELSRSGAFESF